MKLVVMLVTVAAAPVYAALAAPQWNPGGDPCTAAAAETQVFPLDDSTFVMRQSPCIDAEAPLVYLLVGEQRALLIDTGASEAAAQELVDLVEARLARTPAALPLTVVHTHAHSDHRAGDGAFAKLPGVTVAPLEGAQLRAFFGFRHWPEDAATLDLGNRVVDVVPAPGHEENHVVFYDRRNALLFTGDFLLPGRLLVSDITAYRASARRVAAFTKNLPVAAVLGAHIELDTAGTPYPSGSTVHPSEHALALTKTDLLALPADLAAFNGFYARHLNYVVVNPVHNLLALLAGAVLSFALLVWIVRRVWRRRRAARVSEK